MNAIFKHRGKSGTRLRAIRSVGVMALVLLLAIPSFARAEASPWAEAEVRALQAMEAQPPEWRQAHAAFAEAAGLGSMRAKSYLGWLHEHGHGVERDPHEAARWYAEVAGSGVPEFAVKLGWMYLGGAAGSDPVRAEQWFRLAIDAGHLPANVALASVFIADAVGGLAVERVNEACELLERALDGGERIAAFFLARLHVEGIGGHPVRPVQGAHYTRIAAEDGHAQMQGWLALMHLKGDGVPVDRSKAAFWAALAAGSDDPLGRTLHEALARELTADERKAVMERTLLWALDRSGRS